MMQNRKVQWFVASILFVFFVTCMWAVYNSFFACVETRFSLQDQEVLSEKRHQGIVFEETDGGAKRFSLFSVRYQCLQFERWSKGEAGAWEREPERVGIKFGAGLDVVPAYQCSARGPDSIPSVWAISPTGRNLAWLSRGSDAGDREGGSGSLELYVAELDREALVSPGPITSITKNALPAVKAGASTAHDPQVVDLQFAGDDRLVLSYEGDRAIIWDCVQNKPVSEYRLVEGADVLEVQGESVVSSSFAAGKVGFTAAGGWPSEVTVLHLLESDGSRLKVKPTERTGTALAVGPGKVAVLGSSQGTYAVVREEEGRAQIVVGERPLPVDGLPITEAVWFGEETVAFGGGFGALQVITLDLDQAMKNGAMQDSYSMTLQAGPTELEWLAIHPSRTSIVYGTRDRAYVGNLRSVCKHGDIRRAFGVVVSVAGFLSFLATIFTLVRGRDQ